MDAASRKLKDIRKMGKCRENKLKPEHSGRIITIGKTTDIPSGRGATVKLRSGSEIAVFNSGGQYYASENFCAHKGYPLVDSDIDEDTVECRFHGWKFNVRTGECLTKKRCAIDVYEVLIQESWIKIRV